MATLVTLGSGFVPASSCREQPRAKSWTDHEPIAPNVTDADRERIAAAEAKRERKAARRRR